jgi:hypothetical protein
MEMFTGEKMHEQFKPGVCEALIDGGRAQKDLSKEIRMD